MKTPNFEPSQVNSIYYVNNNEATRHANLHIAQRDYFSSLKITMSVVRWLRFELYT